VSFFDDVKSRQTPIIIPQVATNVLQHW